MQIDSDIKFRPFESNVRKCEILYYKEINTLEKLQDVINKFPKHSYIRFDQGSLFIEYIGIESDNEKYFNDRTLQIYRDIFIRKNRNHDLQTLLTHCKLIHEL